MSAKAMRAAVGLVLMTVSLGWAQLARGSDPAQVADEAVQAWLASERPDPFSLANASVEETCRQLPALLQNPPPPEGTEVTFAQRRELSGAQDVPADAEVPDGAETKIFSYPAALPSGQLEVVRVTVVQSGEGWEASGVAYGPSLPESSRAWLQTPVASWLFVLFSLVTLYLLLRPSFLRRWLAEGWQVVRAHRRLVAGTLIGLYALFGLGLVTGANLPEACAEPIFEVISAAVSAVGATEAYTSLNPARAAVVTFYQNFGVVTLSVLFSLGLLFGLPAYLFGSLSFYAQAIPFGIVSGIGAGQLLLAFVLLVLELTSYFLVIAGGGLLFMTLIRKGFRGFSEGIRKHMLMLPFAFVLLMIGAWYEAGIIILPQLLGGP